MNTTQSRWTMKKAHPFAMTTGLIVAWGGPALLISPAVSRILGPAENLAGQLVGQAAMWALLGIILAIVLFWEQRPLSSLGLRTFSWRSIGWGVGLAALTMYVVMPVLTWALRALHIPAFEAGMAKVLVLPVWIRLIATITAGVVEDGLFLGYAFTRLEEIVGTRLGGAISIAAAALLHVRHWGWGPVFAFLVTGIIATAFFVWRRDLLANITAHVMVDTMGIVLVPVLSGGFS